MVQGRGDDPRETRSYLRHLHLGASIAVALVLGLVAGDWLDGKTGWAPAFTLLGCVLGMALGMAYVIREVGREER